MTSVSVPGRFVKTPELAPSSALAITHAAVKYGEGHVEIRGPHIMLSFDVKDAYNRAMQQLQEALDALQQKYKTDETQNFFACRAIDVWKEALADPKTKSLISDVQVLSKTMNVSVPVKGGFTSPMDSLIQPHNQLMDRLDWLSSSSKLHTLLEKIALNAAAG